MTDDSESLTTLDELVASQRYSLAVSLALSLLQRGVAPELLEDELCYSLTHFATQLLVSESVSKSRSGGGSGGGRECVSEWGSNGVAREGNGNTKSECVSECVSGEWLWRKSLELCEWRSAVLLLGYAKFKCASGNLLGAVDLLQSKLSPLTHSLTPSLPYSPHLTSCMGKSLNTTSGHIGTSVGMSEGVSEGPTGGSTYTTSHPHTHTETIGTSSAVIALHESLENMKTLVVDQWHYRMLNDKERNVAYDKAIRRALQLRPGAVVLDIGGGTALLSMFAARAGAKHVYCCEV